MLKGTFRFKTILSRLLFFNLILILIATIVPQIFLYHYFTSQYKQKLAQSNYENTMQVRDFVDESIFERLVSIPVTYFSDITGNNSLIYPLNHDIRGQSYKILEVSKKIYEIQGSYHFVANLNLYYSVNELLFRGSHVYFLKPSVEAPLDPPWLRELTETTENLAWKVVEGEQAAFVYERSIPYFGSGSPNRAMLAIEVDRDALVQAVEKTRIGKDGFFCIVTEQGELVAGTRQESPAIKPSDEIVKRIYGSAEAEDGFFKSNLDGREFLVSYADSRYNSWKYMSLIPTDEAFAGMIDMKLWLAALSMVFTCLNILFAVMITKKAHSPMESVMNNIRNYVEADQTVETEKNQYQMLDKTFHSLAFQVRDLNEHLAANQPIIYHNMIRRILAAQEQHIYRDAEIIHFKKPLFCSFILQLVYLGDQNIHNKMLVHYSATDFLNLRHTWYDVYSITDEKDCIYGILNYSDTDNLRTIMDDICDCMEKSVPVSVSACVGRTVGREEEISESYQEALETLKYLFFYSGNIKLYYEDLNFPQLKTYGNMEKSLEKVRTALSGGEWSELQRSVDLVISQVSDQLYTADYRMNTLMDLVSIVRKAAVRAGYDEGSLFGGDIREQMKTIHRVDAFREWMDRILCSFIRVASERKKGTASDLKDAIEAYVETNIFHDLSLAGMSEELCISASHLSRIFKSVMGVNCSEYLVQAKLGKALELLSETDDTVKEISEKLGYASTAHFIRIFKEQFGMTPKQKQMQLRTKGSGQP